MGWEYDTRHRMRMTRKFILTVHIFAVQYYNRDKGNKEERKSERKKSTPKQHATNTRHSLVITNPTTTPAGYISKECPKLHHNFPTMLSSSL